MLKATLRGEVTAQEEEWIKAEGQETKGVLSPRFKRAGNFANSKTRKTRESCFAVHTSEEADLFRASRGKTIGAWDVGE